MNQCVTGKLCPTKRYSFNKIINSITKANWKKNWNSESQCMVLASCLAGHIKYFESRCCSLKSTLDALIKLSRCMSMSMYPIVEPIIPARQFIVQSLRFLRMHSNVVVVMIVFIDDGLSVFDPIDMDDDTYARIQTQNISIRISNNDAMQEIKSFS